MKFAVVAEFKLCNCLAVIRLDISKNQIKCQLGQNEQTPALDI